MPKRDRLSVLATGGLILAFALGAAILYVWLTERHHERERKYQPDRQQYESTKGSLPPGVATDGERSIADPKNYREEWRSEHDLEAQREMAEWAFLMMVASFVSVGVTTIGVIYVARTLTATRDAVRVTAKGTEAAVLAAEAAQKANDILIDSNEQMLRAYMSRKRELPIPRKGPGDHFLSHQIRIAWANGGQTPARRCCYYFGVEKRLNEIPRDFPFDDPRKYDIKYEGHSDIGPGQEVIHRYDLTAGELRVIRLKEMFVYFYSWIEYDDVVTQPDKTGKRPRRRSETCFQVVVDGDPTRNDLAVRLHSIPWFNGADDSCEYPTQT